MAKLQALILAAGRGSRLGGSSEQVPKCLLEIGRKRLIEHQLEALAEAGVGPTAMVLGYSADEVREVVGIRADYLHNPRWANTNSLYSFWLARDWVKGPVMVLNSDVLFAPAIIERMLDAPDDAIALDMASGDGREQMKVELEDGRVVDMSKTLPAERSHGENVGILKLSEATARLVFERAGALIADGKEQDWVGSAIRQVAQEQHLQAVDVAGLPWVEIDFPVDLDKARKDVWPAIRGRAWERTRWRRFALAACLLAVLAATMFVTREVSVPDESTRPGWETAPLVAGPAEVEVSLGGVRTQRWWLIESGEHARAKVEGPGTIRIETRLLDAKEAKQGDAKEGDARYVIAVGLDDEVVDWFKHKTRASGKATHPRWTIGRKKRVSIDVPEGVHTVWVDLVAPPTRSMLVRVRQVEGDGDE